MAWGRWVEQGGGSKTKAKGKKKNPQVVQLVDVCLGRCVLLRCQQVHLVDVRLDRSVLLAPTNLPAMTLATLTRTARMTLIRSLEIASETCSERSFLVL